MHAAINHSKNGDQWATSWRDGSASGRQLFQHATIAFVAWSTTSGGSIQQSAHIIERGCRLYTDVVESVPAFKSYQSTLLREVGGIAENENVRSVRALENVSVPSMALAFSAALRSSCSFALVLAADVSFVPQP
jgi:hypothetical protein